MPPAADASSVVKLTQTSDKHPEGAYLQSLFSQWYKHFCGYYRAV